MTPELWRDVSQAFEEILQLDDVQQQRYLDDLRARNSEVHDAVVGMLRDQETENGAAQTPLLPSRMPVLSGEIATRPPTAATLPFGLPERIGRYRLGAEIARGGMGVVLRVEDESFGRPLAMKLLLTNDTSAGIIERFLREARLTGQLQHPGVPPVQEMGRLEDGRPWFIMKLVKGSSLADLLKARPSPAHDLPRFIAIFGQICQTLAYAHSLGIIHRDLKPGNIMVGAFGEVQVMDWGLAKVLSFSSQETAIMDDPTSTKFQLGKTTLGIEETEAGAVLGTPVYMAPEQASGHIADLGPATDVYSLGATLFSLLTNRVPVAGNNTADVLGKVKRGDAGFRGAGVRTQGIPAALVAICNKAMAVRPQDRYANALALAKDLEHWLADEPVSAAVEPVSVRASRWMRKHPRMVSGVAAAVLVAVAGLTIGAILMGEKNQELSNINQSLGVANTNLRSTSEKLDLARKSAETAAEIEKAATKQAIAAADKERQATALAVARLGHIEKTNALMESIFTDINPSSAKKGGPLLIEQLRDRLLATADKIDEEAIGDQLSVARFRTFLGNTLANLGEPNKAIELHARAKAILEQLLGPDHPDTLVSMNNLARGYWAAGKLDLALPLLEETLKLRKDKLGPNHPDTLDSMNDLAWIYQTAGKLDQALPLCEETLKLRKAKLGPDHLATFVSMNNLASGYWAAGKRELALPLLEEAFKLIKAKLGPDHPDTLSSMNFLARSYYTAGKLDQALPLCEETLKLRKAKLGPDHPATLVSMNNLASCYQATSKLNLALPLYEETLKLRKIRLGADHPDTLLSMNNLAWGYQGAGKLDRALPLYEETLKLMKEKLGPDHPNTLLSMNNLASGYKDAGKLDLARPLYEETLKLMQAKLLPGHTSTTTCMYSLALCYHAANKLELALPLYEETLKLRKTKLGPDHPDTLTSMNYLALCYHAANKLELALPLYEETLKFRKEKLGPEHPDTLKSMNNLAWGYQAADKLELALPLYEETLRLMKATLIPGHTSTTTCMYNLAGAFFAAKQPAKAVHLFNEYLAVKRQQFGAGDPRLANQLAVIALDFLKHDQYIAAEPLLRECLDIRVKNQPESWSTFNSKAMLGAALFRQNKHQDAEPLLIDGYEGMKAREKTIPAPARGRLLETAEQLAKLYEATGRKEEATKWARIIAEHRRADGKLLEPIHDPDQDLKLTGKLDANAALIYQVRLKAGVNYEFHMEGTDPKALDPYLSLRDDQAKTLAEDNDSGGGLNARIVFRAPTDGIYQVRAGAFNNGRGEFTLMVRPK